MAKAAGDQPLRRACPSCEKALPISAFGISPSGRPHKVCRMCVAIGQARRGHRLSGGKPRQWTAVAAELLMWELDRRPTPSRPDTREEILAFWGVDEAFVEDWRARLVRPLPAAEPPSAWHREALTAASPAVDADVIKGLEFLASLSAHLMAIERQLDRIARRLQAIDRLAEALRELGEGVEALGARLAALEAHREISSE
jgi:hypothetical protein